MNDSLLLSLTTITRSLWRAGEAAVPNAWRPSSRSSSLIQASLPEKSMAATMPMLPK